MRKIKLWVDTGFYGAMHQEVIEVEDDYMDEDLDGIARDYMFENIQYGWDEVEE